MVNMFIKKHNEINLAVLDFGEIEFVFEIEIYVLKKI